MDFTFNEDLPKLRKERERLWAELDSLNSRIRRAEEKEGDEFRKKRDEWLASNAQGGK